MFSLGEFITHHADPTSLEAWDRVSKSGQQLVEFFSSDLGGPLIDTLGNDDQIRRSIQLHGSELLRQLQNKLREKSAVSTDYALRAFLIRLIRYNNIRVHYEEVKRWDKFANIMDRAAKSNDLDVQRNYARIMVDLDHLSDGYAERMWGIG